MIKGKYFIMDGDNAQRTNIAQCINADENGKKEFRYIHEYLRFWGKPYSSDKYLRDVLDYGFDISEKDGIATFKKISESGLIHPRYNKKEEWARWDSKTFDLYMYRPIFRPQCQGCGDYNVICELRTVFNPKTLGWEGYLDHDELHDEEGNLQGIFCENCSHYENETQKIDWVMF